MFSGAADSCESGVLTFMLQGLAFRGLGFRLFVERHFCKVRKSYEAAKLESAGLGFRGLGCT